MMRGRVELLVKEWWGTWWIEEDGAKDVAQAGVGGEDIAQAEDGEEDLA